MNTAELDVIWHDAECGAYREDLPLWLTLADACGGPVLDVGAGTGRVALPLAAAGHEVTAVDIDAALLAALADRASAAGIDVETCCTDARTMEGVTGGFSLALVPMQTVQLLGGASGRRAFLRALQPLMNSGGLVAIAIADALSAFDGDADGLPPADQLIVDGVLYSSQTVAMTEHDGHAVIHRLRTIGDAIESDYNQTALDLVAAETVESEALLLGYRRRPGRQIAETPEYVGSTVVIAGA